MFFQRCCRPQHQTHAFANFYGREREGVSLVGRRGMLKASLAGVAGLSLPELLRTRATAAEAGRPTKSAKSCREPVQQKSAIEGQLFNHLVGAG